MSDARASGARRRPRPVPDVPFAADQMFWQRSSGKTEAAFEDAMRVALEHAPQLAARAGTARFLASGPSCGPPGVQSRQVSADEGLRCVRPTAPCVLLGVPTRQGRPREASRLGEILCGVACIVCSMRFGCIGHAHRQMLQTEGEFLAFWIARSVISAASGIDHQQIVAHVGGVLRLRTARRMVS
jgi:hypothetical protein